MIKNHFDVIVIGGGPAGLASAIAAKEAGGEVLIIEREAKLGGILKQCIHDGFGITRFGERLTGPEYAYKDIKKVEELEVSVLKSTFVLDIQPHDGYTLTVTNLQGIQTFTTKALVFATGCRERTAKQIFIHGTRPAGIFTAGTAQYLVNIDGLMPAKKCVILGSGDIGLIMARRLTLEGAEVLGVYEAKKTPSGLNRNIVQCLHDFNIPLYLQKTVTRVFGDHRLEAIEVASVDDKMTIIKGSEERIPCDTLILSVGLIPENELSEKLGIDLCDFTKGALVDNHLQTSLEGVFAAGNALSVNDLVDYVSENGFIAGKEAMAYVKGTQERKWLNIQLGDGLTSVVPQRVDFHSDLSHTVFYFRANGDYKNKKVVIKSEEKEFAKVFHPWVHQAESIRLVADLTGVKSDIKVEIQ